MSSEIKSYQDLIVWQKSIKLVERIYNVTSEFPENEKFGITQQIRRSSVSVPSNIAEGWGRKTEGSFGYFLSVSRGSLYELETQLFISKNINLLNKKTFDELSKLTTEISKMINSLIKTLKKTNNSSLVTNN